MNIEYDKNFYHKFSSFIGIMMSLIYNMEADGLDNIPKKSNYILSGNHLNILDAGLISKYVKDDLRFMVDKKLYENRLYEYLFKKLGTFGISPNEIDVNAVKTAISLLKEYPIVIFPEGKTHKITEEVPIKPGVGRIAKMTNSLVVPFGIYGTYKPFTDLKINFGEPIDFRSLNLKKEEMDPYLENKIKVLQKR